MAEDWETVAWGIQQRYEAPPTIEQAEEALAALARLRESEKMVTFRLDRALSQPQVRRAERAEKALKKWEMIFPAHRAECQFLSDIGCTCGLDEARALTRDALADAWPGFGRLDPADANSFKS